MREVRAIGEILSPSPKLYRLKMSDRATYCNGTTQDGTGKIYRCPQRSMYYLIARSQTINLCKYHAVKAAEILVKEVFGLDLEELVKPSNQEEN